MKFARLIAACAVGPALLAPAAVYGLTRPTQCLAISDADAIARADWRLRDSFGDRPDSMLGDRTANRLEARRVTRDRFGDAAFDSVNVHFADREDGREVLVARIFGDCEIEWRPVREPVARTRP